MPRPTTQRQCVSVAATHTASLHACAFTGPGAGRARDRWSYPKRAYRSRARGQILALSARRSCWT
eukprot:353284-Chlamydomonas_euryale.AAC.4